MDRKTVSYVCKYAPVELIEACGAKARRLDPAPADFECADACAHPNLCGYGKGVIEAVRAEGVRAMVFTDCCDVMRRVCDVLKAQGDLEFAAFLPFPHKEGEAEVGLFASALEDLKRDLCAYTGEPFDEAQLLARWREGAARAAEEETAAAASPHVAIAGAHCGKTLAAEIAAHIPAPVFNESCGQYRRLDPPKAARAAAGSDAQQAPLAAYARALLRQHRPCMRMLAQPEEAEPATRLGTVFQTVKFCDYYGFAYAKLQKGAARRLVKIETDGTLASGGQLATRLEAFAESLGLAGLPGQTPRDGARRNEDSMNEKDRLAGGSLYVAGIDSGSTSTDVVVMDRDRRICGSAIVPTGQGAGSGAEKALAQALEAAGLTRGDLSRVVSTGYGRESVADGGRTITEISCHARGAHFLCPKARTVIDIGGQDSKVIALGEDGSVQNFVMNDKCAAGTGRFLEMMARTLGMSLEELSERGLAWRNDVAISSMCTVFAESEVVSLIAQDTPAEDIIHGLNNAVAAKTAGLVRRLGAQPGYLMSGGVAQNAGVVKALEEKLGAPVTVPEHAQLCGAIGAALYALE